MTIVPDPQKKKGIFDSLSIFEKIIIIVIVATISTIIIFGFSLTNIPQFILNVLIVCGLLVALFFIVTGVMSYFEPKAYSPSGDFILRIVNIALKLKSPNVHNLWLRGEGYIGRSFIGVINGFAFLPYLSAKNIKDKDGNNVWMKYENGEYIQDKDGNRIPQREIVTEKDGDLLFVVKQGFLGMGKPLLIRCHRSLCNPKMVGDIYITDVGFMPYGSNWLYPSSQYQSTLKKIMNQNEIETIAMTHYAFLDLVADVTRLSISSEPLYAKLLNLRSEAVMSTPVGSNMQVNR